MQRTHHVAIIGMSCKVPGANNIPEFLNLLRTAKEGIKRIPSESSDSNTIPNDISQHPNYVPYKGMLDDVKLFDAGFFNMSPRQATLLDPQQRIWLECVYLAMEDANYVPNDQDLVGVYTGCRESTYLLNNVCQNTKDIDRLLNLDGTEAYQWFISNDKDSIATRTSFLLNFTGPSVTVQTACSTSLVAVAEACKSLRLYECDVCIAGGVTITFPYARGHLYQEGSIYSKDGRCCAFDEAASGTVFGNGAGVVLLKRLEDALEQNDTIHAVIKGWAINNDGADKASFAAPSIAGQTEVVALAQSMAQVDPNSITYVETHGTGTLVGDPIEVEGLSRAFRKQTEEKRFCGIGSVKSNIGHLDAASGVAGLIKTVLSLKHRQLFPSLHFKAPNPDIDFENSPFYVVDKLQPWESDGITRKAGVTSLGVGGTNCHVILEEAPATSQRKIDDQSSIGILPFSAKDGVALGNLTNAYSHWLDSSPEVTLQEIFYTASTCRIHYSERAFICANNIDDLRKRLYDFKLPTNSQPSAMERPVIAFLFTGQGAQRFQMALCLMDLFTEFRSIMMQCDDILSEFMEHSIIKVIQEESLANKYLDRTDYTQPALFTVEYALAQLWKSWGVTPEYLIGHSLGEYVAACVAGVFSLEDALRLVFKRGQLMHELPGEGSMAAVFTDKEQVVEALENYSTDDLTIAAVNSPEHYVISGKTKEVKKILSYFREKHINTRELSVSQAFHSAMIEPMIPAFSKELEGINMISPAIPIISNLTGKVIGNEITTHQYWLNQIRKPVNFVQGIHTLIELGCNLFLEIGPQDVLIKLGKSCSFPDSKKWVSSLDGKEPDQEHIMEALGQLYQQGVDISWQKVYKDHSTSKIQLPLYPFNLQEYWSEATTEKTNLQGSTNIGGRNPLLGERLLLPGSSEIRYQTFYSITSPSYLDDHRLFDNVVVPGSSHLAMLLSAADQLFPGQSCILQELVFLKPIVITSVGSTLQLIFNREERGYKFQLASLKTPGNGYQDDDWTTHLTGDLSTISSIRKPNIRIEEFKKKASSKFPGKTFYETLWANNSGIGDQFRWINTVWQGKGEALCSTFIPTLFDDLTYFKLHPGLIEASFQLLHCCAVFETEEQLISNRYTYVPFSISKVYFHKEPGQHHLWCYARLTSAEAENNEFVMGDLQLLNDSGELVVEIVGFKFRRLAEATLTEGYTKLNRLLYQHQWEQIPLPPPEVMEDNEWLILADRTGVASVLERKLMNNGITCTLVYRAAHDGIDVQSIFSNRSRAFQTVVYLWALDEPEIYDNTIDEVTSPVHSHCVLKLAKALTDLNIKHTPKLWVITRGVTDEPGINSLQQSAVWGMGRVLSREQTSMETYLLDLNSTEIEKQADILSAVLRSANPESLMAYRQGKLWGARLSIQHPNDQFKSFKINLTDTYIISGGISELSLELANWLAYNRASTVIITDCLEQDIRLHETIIGNNTVCIHCNLNTTEQPQVRELWEHLHEEGLKVNGIFILPKSIGDGVLDTLNEKTFRASFLINARSAWNLHEATLTNKIPHFVCFSSNSALLGTPGQINYAASCAFLDQLIQYRYQNKLSGITINWGPWASLGATLQLTEQGKAHMRNQGWEPIETMSGMNILGYLMQVVSAQTAVLQVDWETLIRTIPKYVRPFYCQLEDDLAIDETWDLTNLNNLLIRSTSPERADLMLFYLRKMASDISGYPVQRFEVTGSLLEFGFDSLMAVMLSNRIKSKLQISLSLGQLLGGLNIQELATKLLKDWENHIQKG